MRKLGCPFCCLLLPAARRTGRDAGSHGSTDPDAAVAFAQEGCGGLGCSVDDGSSGTSGNWTDVTTDEDIFDVPEDEPEAWGQCSEWMDDALAAG